MTGQWPASRDSDAVSVAVDGRAIQLSSLSKLMFPDDGITKSDLIRYYGRIAPVMVPHIKDRPLSLERFPDGVGAPGFYQKEAPAYFPEWIPRVAIPVRGDASVQPQIVANDAATLVYLANHGCITPHAWLSRADDLSRPDRIIFDLDPAQADFMRVRRGANILRALLEALGLVPFVMTTGSRGLHVLTPIRREADFETVRAFAQRVADGMAAEHPDEFTTQIRKAARGGRVFIDYLRNAYAQTAVPAYAVRARPGAPVATPVSWDELDRVTSPRKYTLRNIFRRLGRVADPWANLPDDSRSMLDAADRLTHRASG